MCDEQIDILIVDSDPDARECLRDLLEVEGYSTMSAPPGPEALYLARRSQACIVLIGAIQPARTGLQTLALVQHERFLLETAIKVMHEAQEARAYEPVIETIDERKATQRIAVEAARRQRKVTRLHPIPSLAKTSLPRERSALQDDMSA